MASKFSTVLILGVVLVFFAGCSSNQKPLMLKKFGPTETRAGQIFNLQPGGVSAFWAETENVTPNTVMVLNGVSLASAPSPDGKGITAAVPKNLYETPGEYPLLLLDTKTNQKSNELKFTVKP